MRGCGTENDWARCMRQEKEVADANWNYVKELCILWREISASDTNHLNQIKRRFAISTIANAKDGVWYSTIPDIVQVIKMLDSLQEEYDALKINYDNLLEYSDDVYYGRDR